MEKTTILNLEKIAEEHCKDCALCSKSATRDLSCFDHLLQLRQTLATERIAESLKKSVNPCIKEIENNCGNYCSHTVCNNDPKGCEYRETK